MSPTEKARKLRVLEARLCLLQAQRALLAAAKTSAPVPAKKPTTTKKATKK